MASEEELRAYLRRAAAELHRTRQRLAAHSEPVVVLGAGCRFPGGVASPEDLWELVREERETVSPPPAERGWDPAPGLVGGFLTGIADFDPAFFGLGAREGALLDPQQRLLLETSWEALTRSGLDPSALHGSRTAVFVGLTYSDFHDQWRTRVPEADLNALVTGSSMSLAAGRLSYTYGFRGPAVTVDTACSSGLVALHQAVFALRNGECDLALVCAAAVLSSPDMFGFSRRQGVLSADGRCRSFSAGADGWGLAEGAATLVLQRLSDHERGALPALAVVRGSAVNQVGAGPGLTAPTTVSQRQVMEAALASAGLTAADVDLVEGHGTGTALGDAVEVRAVAAAYGAHRPPGSPVLLGSLKSNIGHTQMPGGLGGVLKAALAMRHGLAPRSLHAEAPLEEVDWASANVGLLDTARPWPEREEGPRRAGVSSFGLSGTNAHVVLEQPPPEVAGRHGGRPLPRYRRARHWPVQSPNPQDGTS
jgi:acyl transferase domain-containing protein